MKLLDRLWHAEAAHEDPIDEDFPATVRLRITTNRGIHLIEGEKSAFNCPCGTQGSLYRLPGLGYDLCLHCFTPTQTTNTPYAIEAIQWLDTPTPD